MNSHKHRITIDSKELGNLKNENVIMRKLLEEVATCDGLGPLQVLRDEIRKLLEVKE